MGVTENLPERQINDLDCSYMDTVICHENLHINATCELCNLGQVTP